MSKALAPKDTSTLRVVIPRRPHHEADMTIEFTVFVKPSGILSKQITLKPDGSISSDGSACMMSEGVAYRYVVNEFEHLANVINTMSSNHALCLGQLPSDRPDMVPVTLASKVVEGGEAIARSNQFFKFLPDRFNIVALDFDLKGMPQDVADRIESKGGLWNALVEVFPDLRDVATVTRLSTSSCIYTTDGRQFPSSGGVHTYIMLRAGCAPEPFIRTLFDRCWLHGLGWYQPNKLGILQERTIIDKSAVGPARLMFEGAPIIGPGLVQDTAQRAAKFTPGGVTHADRLLPLNMSERADLSRIKHDTKKKMEPAVQAILDQRITELVMSGLPIDVAQRQVLSNYKGELSPGHILYFMDKNIGAVTVEDVINNPVAYDHEDLADPADGAEGKTNKAKFYANRMMIHSFAHGERLYRLPLDPSALFGTTAIPSVADVVAEMSDEGDDGDKEVSSTIHNVRTKLRTMPDFRDIFRYNSFLGEIEVMRKIPDVDHRHEASTDETYPRALTDVDTIRITARLQASEMPKAKLTDVENAVKLISASNRYDPLKTYLLTCLKNWDNIPRIETMLIDYAGAEDTEYVRGVTRMFMISLAARGINPGTKVDTMLVMESEQDRGKSTLGRTLPPDPSWFSDSMPPDISSRDALQHLRGKWIIEVAEMDHLSKNDSSTMKQFLTRQVDRYRDPYAKYEKSHPRTVCFYGTVNLSRYLKDETGNRRYWPVRCRGEIDSAGIASVRDQLFGEAVYLHLAGVPHWPTREWANTHCVPEQNSRAVGDSWEDIVEEFLDKWLSKEPFGMDVTSNLPNGWESRRSKGVVSVQDIVAGALKIAIVDKLDFKISNRITNILTRAKWEYCGDTKYAGRRSWRKKS